MAAAQIPLNQILAAMDLKDREFYDNLDDELKKKFSPFMMIKYLASVHGSSDLEHYYIAMTNECANKNMFALTKEHRKLQWLMLTAVSPGDGAKRHSYLKQKPKSASTSTPVYKQLLELFPAMKPNDAEVLSKLITKKELTQYVKDHGES